MFGYQGQQGLLGSQAQGSGLLGGQTQDLMKQYLQSLFMRRYQPPAIPQQPGMVGLQMGPGGMQYMAPQVQQAVLPGAQQAPAPVAPQGPQFQAWQRANPAMGTERDPRVSADWYDFFSSGG